MQSHGMQGAQSYIGTSPWMECGMCLGPESAEGPRVQQIEGELFMKNKRVMTLFHGFLFIFIFLM